VCRWIPRSLKRGAGIGVDGVPKKAARLLALGLLTVSLAGCGGDDEGGASSATEWADDVCSATTTWTESIRSTVDSLRGGGLSEDELRDAVDDVESATTDYVDDLRGLGRPDTEAGEEAKASLDQLAGDIEDTVSTIRTAVDDASGLSEITAAVTAASATLSSMQEQLSSTLAELRGLDAGGELDTAFSEADSCRELESGGS
jgi:ABC-type transporter Mla subunit MlaD